MIYDQFQIDQDQLIVGESYQQCVENKLRKKVRKPAIFAHFLVQELRDSHRFRNNFLLKCSGFMMSLKMVLIEPLWYSIDYEWNYRLSRLVIIRGELDVMFSWLSTLGGAYSSLGTESTRCAQIAGLISKKQLQISKSLQDPVLISRCYLFYALSLIQQQTQLKKAKKLIECIYLFNKKSSNPSVLLNNSCKGIWSILQHSFRSKKLQSQVLF